MSAVLHRNLSSFFPFLMLRWNSFLNLDVVFCCLWQVINLIPFNPIGTLSHFSTSKENKVVRFQKILREVYNIRTTVRKEMGQDISGACGQLVVNNIPEQRFTSSDVVTDIEDLRI